MATDERVDLRGVSFADFIAFFFDRPVEESSVKNEEPWYFHIRLESEYDPRLSADHYIRLFSDPAFLLGRFTRSQLETGFWAMMSSPSYGGAKDIVWCGELPWELRERLIRSMKTLYSELFALEPLDTSSHMWWDSIVYAFQDVTRSFPDLYPDAGRVESVVFEVLEEILSLPSHACQMAALHGLGHLHHVRTGELVEAYLSANPTLDERAVAYARAASAGRVR